MSPTNAELNQQVKLLQEALQSLRSELEELREDSSPNMVVPNIPHNDNNSGDIRLCDPVEFDGKRDKTSMFLAQCDLHFQARSKNFQSELSKILFAASFLRGEAFAWYEAKALLPKTQFENFNDFAYNLKLTFGEDPQLSKDRVYNDLLSLKQRYSVQAYVSRFIQLCARLQLDEETKISIFRRGLKPDIQRFLLGFPHLINSFNSVCGLAVSFDNNIFALSRQNQNGNLGNYYPEVKPFNRGKFPNEKSTLNAIGQSTRRQRLSPEERDRRIQLGLCIFCGIDGCPGSIKTEDCSILKNRTSGKGKANQD